MLVCFVYLIITAIVVVCMGSCVCTSVEWEGVNRYPFILNKSLIANQKKKKFITIQPGGPMSLLDN